MVRSSLFLLFFFIVTCGFSQMGTIKGTVNDAVSGEAIVGANVYIMGSTQGAAVDIDGNFEIPKVKAGTYTVITSFISYRSDSVANVTVYPDQTTVLNVALNEDVQSLESVDVTARRLTNTDVSVITELKASDLVAVGISSQMIQMSQDKDAAQVMQRVPGVTIIDGRFVNVRGLSERYSTVLLNGVIAPSTEVDSKAFSFDLIPSNMIDQMLIYKSGSAEFPGEFAGAVIDIYTKSIVDDNATSISIGGGFRAGTVGQNFQMAEDKGKTDFLGYDDGGRSLPAGFPTENLRSLSQNATTDNLNKLENATKLLPNTWGTRAFTAMPDLKLNVNFSRSIAIGRHKLDNITALNYSQANLHTPDVAQYYYEQSGPRYEYHDERYRQTDRIGGVSNFTFEFNPSNRIEFRNFFNQQGQNEASFRTGQEFLQGFDIRSQAFNYFARGIYSGQLNGHHAISDALTIDWIFGYNNASASHPDYRRIRAQRGLNTTGPYAIVIPPGANNFEAGRFYSNLNENTYTAVGNVTYKLNPQADVDRQTRITAGYYLEKKDRTFRARWMSYKWASFNAIDLSLLYTSFDSIFVPQNLGTHFLLEEGTNEGPANFDNYDGHNELAAGHIGIATPLGEHFRLSMGARVEYNDLSLVVYDENRKDSTVSDVPLTVPMPFFNLSYNFTEKMLVRLAYSRTVNRPVFRELAPFDYYDFDNNADVLGNPNLKTAKIDNVDLSWELYPSSAERISFGAFYKHFNTPIEITLDQESNLIYRPLNASAATDYGLETEVRKSLDTFTASNFIHRMSLVFNAAWIKSQINFPNTPEYEKLVKNRPLQGQSPYIFNASVFYNDPDAGLQFSVMYNVFGTRIYAVGDKDQNPTQFEMPRNVIDFTIARQFGTHLEVKAGVQDLLNQQYRLMQDTNFDGKITSADDKIRTFRTGQLMTLGLTWAF